MDYPTSVTRGENDRSAATARARRMRPHGRSSSLPPVSRSRPWWMRPLSARVHPKIVERQPGGEIHIAAIGGSVRPGSVSVAHVHTAFDAAGRPSDAAVERQLRARMPEGNRKQPEEVTR
jgi:hypothetical protein